MIEKDKCENKAMTTKNNKVLTIHQYVHKAIQEKKAQLKEKKESGVKK